MRCVACKSTSLVEGKITHSDLEAVKFTPGGEVSFSSYPWRRLSIGPCVRLYTLRSFATSN